MNIETQNDLMEEILAAALAGLPLEARAVRGGGEGAAGGCFEID